MPKVGYGYTYCVNAIRYTLGSSQHEDAADAPAAHRQDDLQRVHLLQHAREGCLAARQDHKSGRS